MRGAAAAARNPPPTSGGAGRASVEHRGDDDARRPRGRGAPSSAPRAQPGTGRKNAGGRADEAEGDRLDQVRGEQAAAGPREPGQRFAAAARPRPSTPRRAGRADGVEERPDRARGVDRPEPTGAEGLPPGERAQRLDHGADGERGGEQGPVGTRRGGDRVAGRAGGATRRSRPTGRDRDQDRKARYRAQATLHGETLFDRSAGIRVAHAPIGRRLCAVRSGPRAVGLDPRGRRGSAAGSADLSTTSTSLPSPSKLGYEPTSTAGGSRLACEISTIRLSVVRYVRRQLRSALPRGAHRRSSRTSPPSRPGAPAGRRRSRSRSREHRRAGSRAAGFPRAGAPSAPRTPARA